jgi:DNA polymerase III subunit gamma/tau
MAYRVLARKCRPHTFDEVIGQKHVTRTLRNAIKEQRVAHAFLFSGERGVGKTSIARILAKCLNCQSGPTAEPCGVCPSCLEITNGNCIDVHEIDGASNNGVDDIRLLRENVKYMPSRDRNKIYIIDEVHMLSTSAFNALLKTLEEPPPHVVFIFATTEPHKIPDTILSRCLRFDFKRIPSGDIVEHLGAIAQGENVAISRHGLMLIAREADGSMRDAQTILERAIAYCGMEIADADLQEMLGHIDRQIICRVLKAVIAEDAKGCIDALDEVYQLGIDLKQFYFSLLETLRDIMILKSVKDPARLVDVSDEDMAQLQELEAGVTRQELLRMFRLCFSSENDIVRSALPRIALEVCLLEMMELKRALPLEEIMAQLESLQGTGGFGAQRQAFAPPAAQRSAPAPGRPAVQPQRETPSAGQAGGPATPSPAAAGTGAEAFCAFIKKKSPAMGSCIAHGSVDIGADGSIKVLFPAGSFHMDQLRDGESEARLKELAAEFFGKAVPVAIATGGEKKKTAEHVEKEQRRVTREQVLNNPVIRKIVDTFNGSIVDIRPPAEGGIDELKQHYEAGPADPGADGEAEQ